MALQVTMPYGRYKNVIDELTLAMKIAHCRMEQDPDCEDNVRRHIEDMEDCIRGAISLLEDIE